MYVLTRIIITCAPSSKSSPAPLLLCFCPLEGKVSWTVYIYAYFAVVLDCSVHYGSMDAVETCCGVIACAHVWLFAGFAVLYIHSISCFCILRQQVIEESGSGNNLPVQEKHSTVSVAFGFNVNYTIASSKRYSSTLHDVLNFFFLSHCCIYDQDQGLLSKAELKLLRMLHCFLIKFVIENQVNDDGSVTDNLPEGYSML